MALHPTVPEEVSQFLKDNLERDSSGLLDNITEEEVLFCEPPRGLKGILDEAMCIFFHSSMHLVHLIYNTVNYTSFF